MTRKPAALPLELDTSSFLALVERIGDRWNQWHDFSNFDSSAEGTPQTGWSISIFMRSPKNLQTTGTFLAGLRKVFPGFKSESNGRFMILMMAFDNGISGEALTTFVIDPCGKVLKIMVRSLGAVGNPEIHRPSGIIFASDSVAGSDMASASNFIRKLADCFKGDLWPILADDPCNSRLKALPPPSKAARQSTSASPAANSIEV